MSFTITINGKARQTDLPGEMPLLWVLRDEFELLGTKFGCGEGLCGACTVHVDGAATRSCQLKLGDVGTAKITTIEAIGETRVGAALQSAWLDHDVMQCGYCQAGQLMSATALLASNPRPNRAEVAEAMAGNICRCACYNRIGDAVQTVALRLAESDDAKA